jgi:hypothetical protein
MAFRYAPANIAATFAAAGYDDIETGELITAHRSDGREWEVVLDRGGQLKASISYPSGHPSESTLQIGDHSALMLNETFTTITVIYRLRAASDLADVLKAIEAAVSPGA